MSAFQTELKRYLGKEIMYGYHNVSGKGKLIDVEGDMFVVENTTDEGKIYSFHQMELLTGFAVDTVTYDEIEG